MSILLSSLRVTASRPFAQLSKKLPRRLGRVSECISRFWSALPRSRALAVRADQAGICGTASSVKALTSWLAVARGKTAEVRRAEAHLYLDKADQFVKAAQSELERKRYDSALINAVHSGLNPSLSMTSSTICSGGASTSNLMAGSSGAGGARFSKSVCKGCGGMEVRVGRAGRGATGFWGPSRRMKKTPRPPPRLTSRHI